MALLALFLEYLERLERQDPEEYRRVAYVLDSLVGWLPGVRRRAPQDQDRRSINVPR